MICWSITAPQRTVHNFTFGNASHQHCETISGGSCADPGFNGTSVLQIHMTNSRLADPEVLEKVGSAVTQQHGLMVRARSFPGNKYDGCTLAAQIEQIDQTTTLLQDVGVKPTTAIVDLNCRSADNNLAPVAVIYRGKLKFQNSK